MSDTPLAWGHVNLNVSDLERSIAFYEGLGFSVFIPGIPYLGISREGEPSPIPDACTAALGLSAGTRARGCILRLPGGFPKLDLTEYASEAAGSAASPGGAGYERICLASRDLAADYARFSKAGARFLTEPAEDPSGLAQIAICLDPDGHRIELIQIAIERWSVPGTTGD